MRKTVALLLIFVLVILSATGCGKKTAETGVAEENTPAQSSTSESNTSKSDISEEEAIKGNAEMKLGNLTTDGYALTVPADTFQDGVKVEVTAIPESELARYLDGEKYEIVGTPVQVVSDGYTGGLFDTDVALTLPMPEACEGGLGQLVVLYFDEAGDVQYMLPDTYNSAEKTISVNLPHLSPFSSAKLTEKEQVSMFLDKYAAQEAVARADNKQAAAELEPYIRAKVEALKLSEETERELLVSVINAVGAKFGEDAGTYTDIATSAYQSLDKDDSSDFEAKMEELISGKLVDIIDYNVENGREESCFNDAGKLGTILGAISGGDTETALKEIGDAIGGAVPAAGLTTKAVGYVGAKVNETFTNWKSNQIEDLYQKFKNGYEDMWGNEVISGDEESLKTYLYTASGFSRSKGVYRFYNMDKVAETCEKYGWGRKEYDELDEHYREIFDQRAEEGLLNYFRTRMAQEAEAGKIKQTERECIEEMLQSYGCLSSGNYNKFFGEQSVDDYNLTERLERITRVRGMLTQYVDEDALAKSQKDGIYNWGVLLNDWVTLATENKRDEAVNQFLSKLKSYGVLNPAYDFGVTIDDLAGTYSGSVTVSALRVTEEMYQMYLANGVSSDYGEIDLDIESKADCDAALAEYVDQIQLGQELTIEKTGDNACTVSGTVLADMTLPMSAPAVLENGKLILSTEEGTTEIEVTEEDGLITLRSRKAVFLMEYEEDGEKESFLIEAQINVMK